MLIAHSSDLHITETAPESGATLEEQIETLMWLGHDAACSGARVMVCAGDIFDKVSTVAERNAALSVFTSWAESMPVVIVGGNHDEIHDLRWIGRLDTEHNIYVAERPVLFEQDDWAVACLPWPRKGQVLDFAPGSSPAELVQIAKSGVQAILAGFREKSLYWDCPLILAAHAELGAASMDNGQPVAGRCFVELGVEDLLDVGADYVALGHIHKHQILGDGRICYAGAPRPTKFGETGAKGYCLVDVIKGEAPKITHRRAPYRELITVTADAAGAFDDWDLEASGNSIRLQYTADASDREQARTRAENLKIQLLANGAASVKIDGRTTATHRVRSATVSGAATVSDKLGALWDAREQTPGRSVEILAKLEQLEGGTK